MSKETTQPCQCSDTDVCQRFPCLFGKAGMPTAVRSLCHVSEAHRHAWDAQEAKLREAGCNDDKVVVVKQSVPPKQEATHTQTQQQDAQAPAPGFFQKAMNYGSSLINHARHGFKTVTDEEHNKRRSLCMVCEHRNPDTDTCKLCGCPLSGSPLGNKLRWAHEKCPIDKWGPVESVTIQKEQATPKETSSFRLVAPLGVYWGGRMTKKPYEYNVTAIVPHIETPETLPTIIELLRLQTERPYIIIVDTGSSDPVRKELEDLRADDVEVHYIRAGAYIDYAAPVSAALDLGFSLCETEYLFSTHADCFLMRRDFIEWEKQQCNPTCPIVAYEMSPRTGTEDWKGIPSHTASLYHMPTIHDHNLHWSMPHAFRLLGIDPKQGKNQVNNWPDTETIFGLLMKRAEIKPLLIGHETNFERFVDTNVDHVRSYPGAKLYSPIYRDKMKPEVDKAIADAQARIAAWKQQ